VAKQPPIGSPWTSPGLFKAPLKDLKISLLNAKIRPSKSLYLPSLKDLA
jgi:hypothetical protein